MSDKYKINSIFITLLCFHVGYHFYNHFLSERQTCMKVKLVSNRKKSSIVLILLYIIYINFR